MTRKHYFTSSIIIGTFLLFGLFLTSCQPKVDKDLGIQLYSVRDSMKSNLQGTIEAIGKMGYKFVEPAGYSDGLFYGKSPEEFKALVESNGMIILSSHTGHNYPDSGEWESTMQWWDKTIESHITAGAKYIVQPSMDQLGYSSLAGLKSYCDYFNAIGEKCKAKGIEFGYHNHSKEFSELEGQVIYDYMLQNTDSSNVFFQLDLYWIHVGGGNALDYFKKYPGRFTHFHVKDSAELGGTGSVMDFKPLMESAELAGAKYFFIEVEKYTTGSQIESVKQSLGYLNDADYVK